MAKNSISLKGNLTRDPFFDYLDGRDDPVPFMRFTLAVDRHPPRQAGTDYLQILAYGQRALHDHAYLRQGSEILVETMGGTGNLYRQGHDAEKGFERMLAIASEIEQAKIPPSLMVLQSAIEQSASALG